MAESSNPSSEDAAHSAPSAEAQESEEVADELAVLTQPRRDLLALVDDLFQEVDAHTGILHDLPQVRVASANIVEACRLAKDHSRLDFKLLLCLACVDYEKYFELVYFLQSLQHEQTLVIKTELPYDNPRLPSVASVWQAADWYEREAHDLFGVVFEGHPGLAPLLLYDEFEGYPGRKEYPFYEYQEF